MVFRTENGVLINEDFLTKLEEYMKGVTVLGVTSDGDTHVMSVRGTGQDTRKTSDLILKDFPALIEFARSSLGGDD